MPINNLKILEMLSLLYEDLDIELVERRFVHITSEIFEFDRIALLFVKHRKGCLQGKLSMGFEPGVIEDLQIPISDKSVLNSPLITGLPIWNEIADNDPLVETLGLKSFAVIPVLNKKRVSCWQVNACVEKDCKAYGNLVLSLGDVCVAMEIASSESVSHGALGSPGGVPMHMHACMHMHAYAHEHVPIEHSVRAIRRNPGRFV